ncbi:integumentary mucin C.1-like [Saccostrea cucullata]|uniref:integumentary mucin C.1-like n=1 Tax=Saccostrea cuccullata TaxID=36930 RepID=UPI002ED3EE68
MRSLISLVALIMYWYQPVQCQQRTGCAGCRSSTMDISTHTPIEDVTSTLTEKTQSSSEYGTVTSLDCAEDNPNRDSKCTTTTPAPISTSRTTTPQTVTSSDCAEDNPNRDSKCTTTTPAPISTSRTTTPQTVTSSDCAEDNPNRDSKCTTTTPAPISTSRTTTPQTVTSLDCAEDNPNRDSKCTITTSAPISTSRTTTPQTTTPAPMPTTNSVGRPGNIVDGRSAGARTMAEIFPLISLFSILLIL